MGLLLRQVKFLVILGFCNLLDKNVVLVADGLILEKDNSCQDKEQQGQNADADGDKGGKVGLGGLERRSITLSEPLPAQPVNKAKVTIYNMYRVRRIKPCVVFKSLLQRYESFV